MDNKLIFLMLLIIAVWVLINPTTRTMVKTATSKIFTATPATNG